MLNERPQDSPSSITSPVADSWRLGSLIGSGIGSGAWLVALLTIAAAFLRFHAITAKSFWLDEGISTQIVRLPWPQFVHVLWVREANMALYYLLLRFWMMFGNSEAFVRGLSVLFSAATVPLIYFLGARIFGRRAGLLAALLLTLNAYHIRYAQEARGYALVVFLAVLATWLLVKNLQQPSSAHWALYGILCALTTYSHFFGAMLLPAHAMSFLFLRRAEIPWRGFIRATLVFGAMIVPIAIFVLKAGGAPISWVLPMQADVLLPFGLNFSGNYGRLLLTLDLLAIGIAAFVALRAWQSGERTNESWGYALLFSWLVVPVAMVIAVSFVKPIFVPRFLSFCLPALLLLVAVGISRCRPAALAWGLCVAISICAILGDMKYYRYDFDLNRQDWSTATSYVFDHAQPSDSIFFYYAAGEAPYNYYSSLQKASALRPKVLQEPWMSAEKTLILQDDARSENLINVPGTDIKATPPIGDRVWLVLMFLSGSKQESDTGKAVSNWLLNGRTRVAAKVFPSMAVVLFDRSDGVLADGTEVSVKH